ncbi:MAG: acetoin utilization protein AcuC [Actinobacteria bacterium HGW-Actinobacteria-10]|jgi:acetoin utilization protein AcuC|nr:MAG: acetoin utilization protein AcuC [Actinobacteria bacterium HGW-Actinobacteria-10]
MPFALVYDPALENYRFGTGHPMRPERFSMAVDLMRSWNLISEENDAALIAPADAGERELLLAHSADYIAAVEKASADPSAADSRYGLGPGDTPAFPGMHPAATLAVGATMTATGVVVGGSARRAFAPSGGLHHAHRDRAAGFCVYNDCVVAIEHTTRAHPGMRIAYVDIDAHHGDGVQEAFYERPDVLTLSVHESGSYLYPGTGHPRETGEGPGRGYAMNVALPPYADDACYALSLERAIAPALRAFAPDLVFLQGGADTHKDDPLTHLALTIEGYTVLVSGIIDLTQELCGGRLVMVGGGGYEPFSVVPRMWACAFALLVGVEIPHTVPEDWLAKARRHVPQAPQQTLAEESAAPAREANAEALRLTDRVLEELAGGHPLLSAWERRDIG